MSHNKVDEEVVEDLNQYLGELNRGFELSAGPSSVNSDCCGGVDGDGHLPVYSEKPAACGCEEHGLRCACRVAPRSGDAEGNQKVVYESWDKWKCMCLLIIVVVIVTWIAIFTSILATRDR